MSFVGGNMTGLPGNAYPESPPSPPQVFNNSGIPTNPVSATVYQNTTGKPLLLNVNTLVTTAAGGCVIAMGPNPTGLTTVASPGGAGSALTTNWPYCLIVPIGWYVSFTITTATVTVNGVA